MLFTNLGRIVALALLTGILWVAAGLMIATGALTPEQAAQVFPRARSSGAVVDRGAYMVLFAIALGILTEISRSVHKT